MPDFLLELRSEEIPARMQAGARADLEKLFRKEMATAAVSLGDVTVWSTPRRLALIARGLPDATAAVSEELKGPRVGAPPQALEGFLRKTGLSESQLTARDEVLYAVTEKSGRATIDVLAEAIPAIIRAFPWPKSQRWGTASLSSESLRWVRPLSGIVALFDRAVVPCQVSGIAAGRETLGHRFHSTGPIQIDGADDYAAKLRAAHVIVDHAERQDFIREHALAAAHAEGLVIVADEGLVVENAGLTEWPVPLLGRFDAAFLDVPPEVIQITARTNQKYFICRERTPEGAEQGALANAFICTANIVATDGGAAIIDGNRKVLAARLADARFFWEQDRKKSLSEHAEGLSRITFHEKLGTVADKVERVAKLARWLVEQGIVVPANAGTAGRIDASSASGGQRSPVEPGTTELADVAQLAEWAERAARLCKADLVTEMVGEFPELQGVIGGYYARAEGLPDAVADAIRDHYKPVGQGDDVPSAPVTVAVSLADKLDTLVSFFAIDEQPTGSKDPYALRRAAISIKNLVERNSLRINLFVASREALTNVGISLVVAAARSNPRIDEILSKTWPNFPAYHGGIGEIAVTQLRGEDLTLWKSDVLPAIAPGWNLLAPGRLSELSESLRSFIFERMRVQAKADGLRGGIFESVTTPPTVIDVYLITQRINALQAFIGTADGTNLLAGYKRAANILKKEGVVPAQAGTGGRIDATSASGGQRSPVEPGTTNELSYTPEPAEKALMDALDTAGPQAATAVVTEDFAGAMAALATLRAPIDAFFDGVTVNDPETAKRTARLSLLARFRDAVHGVADFSKIEG